jgi:hypothetical protein
MVEIKSPPHKIQLNSYNSAVIATIKDAKSPRRQDNRPPPAVPLVGVRVAAVVVTVEVVGAKEGESKKAVILSRRTSL